MVRNDTLLELGIIGIMSYFLFFVSTNVNPVLGGIYQGLALLGISLALVDMAYGKRSLRFINKSIDWGKAMFVAIVAYATLIFASFLAAGIAKSIPLTEVLGLLGASAPIFSSSISINFLIFAVVIPIIETYVIFCIALDLFSSMFNIPLEKRNLFNTKLIGLIVVISLAFLLFHTNAKGIDDEAALILVAIMAFMSCLLVIWYQEFRIAILFHIISNVMAYVMTSGFSSVPTAVFLPLLNYLPLLNFIS